MKNKLIPYLQLAIENATIIDFEKKSVISLTILDEFSFSFRHKLDHCDVIVAYDSIGDSVVIKQEYNNDSTLPNYEDVSIESFKNFLSFK